MALTQIIAIASDGTRKAVLVDLNDDPQLVRLVTHVALGSVPVEVRMPDRDENTSGVRGIGKHLAGLFG